MSDGERLHAHALGRESGGERLVGDERGGGVPSRGEPTCQCGEHVARAPPEPARREEGDAARLSRYCGGWEEGGHRLFARSTSGYIPWGSITTPVMVFVVPTRAVNRLPRFHISTGSSRVSSDPSA